MSKPPSLHGLAEGLEAALTAGPEVSRLSYAHTTVRFVAQDADSATLLLDRFPPALGDDEAEITIELSDEQRLAFLHGAFPMSAAVITGSVTTNGPVQDYLMVDPILQLLLARASGNEEEPESFEEVRTRHRRAVDDRALSAEILAIETRDLRKSFGSNQVLAGLDIQIPEGVLSVVLGPSGTGKSVLLQHVIGLLAPDSGSVIVRGRELGQMSRSQLLGLREDIGVMFQDGALFSAMNVYDNVAFPLRQHTDLREHEVRELVMGQLDSVGLAADADKMPNALSGGMRKRAGLARALVLEPSIVLVDEPDSGLDPVRTALLGDLLLERHAEFGGTMVVVTHNVALAKQIADHMSVLFRGAVLESGTTAEVIASESAFIRQFLAGESRGPLGMDA
jgi:phospholipid/cholesterol/gamma-HCH transport system ATP-binding protein